MSFVVKVDTRCCKVFWLSATCVFLCFWMFHKWFKFVTTLYEFCCESRREMLQFFGSFATCVFLGFWMLHTCFKFVPKLYVLCCKIAHEMLQCFLIVCYKVNIAKYWFVYITISKCCKTFCIVCVASTDFFCKFLLKYVFSGEGFLLRNTDESELYCTYSFFCCCISDSRFILNLLVLVGWHI